MFRGRGRGRVPAGDRMARKADERYREPPARTERRAADLLDTRRVGMMRHDRLSPDAPRLPGPDDKVYRRAYGIEPLKGAPTEDYFKRAFGAKDAGSGGRRGGYHPTTLGVSIAVPAGRAGADREVWSWPGAVVTGKGKSQQIEIPRGTKPRLMDRQAGGYADDVVTELQGLAESGSRTPAWWIEAKTAGRAAENQLRSTYGQWVYLLDRDDRNVSASDVADERRARTAGPNERMWDRYRLQTWQQRQRERGRPRLFRRMRGDE